MILVRSPYLLSGKHKVEASARAFASRCLRCSSYRDWSPLQDSQPACRHWVVWPGQPTRLFTCKSAHWPITSRESACTNLQWNESATSSSPHCISYEMEQEQSHFFIEKMSCMATYAPWVQILDMLYTMLTFSETLPPSWFPMLEQSPCRSGRAHIPNRHWYTPSTTSRDIHSRLAP